MSIDQSKIDKHELLGYYKGTIEGIKLCEYTSIADANAIKADTQKLYDALREELYGG